MDHSVGNGRFIVRMKNGARHADGNICIATIVGRTYNRLDDCYDAQYRAEKFFATENDALNYAYKVGKYAKDSALAAEFAAEKAAAARWARG